MSVPSDIEIAQKAISQSARNLQGSWLCHYSDSKNISWSLKNTFLVFCELLSPNYAPSPLTLSEIMCCLC